MGHPVGGVISNRYQYRSIEELKWPILILQWCKIELFIYIYTIGININNVF